MYRFFVSKDQIGEENIFITGTDVNHIKNVLRMKVGGNVLVSDGEDREYICSISEITNDRIVAAIVDINGPSRELPVKVTLYQGLPKSDKMELIIQKMVELGVHRIVPVATKRAVVKLDAKKAESKVKRWNTISESAAKQSKRGIVPEISNVMTYDEAINDAKHLSKVFIPYEEAMDMEKTRKLIADIKPGDSIGVFIGPEGGFAVEEVEKAESIGADAITLGKRILRTETAGLTLMSVIMFNVEE